ncbi:MAG TPA: DNA repair protein RecN [Peptostreptococcaceae bacterium]|nr:DNA repair protein RecN [Peptostreptococcaceae bacterium]
MILELYMKNCALIDELRLSLEEGLNILTGETGSGKSIIIDSLNLCLGDKYDRTFLRRGTKKGLVEAVFCIENNSLKEKLNEYGVDIEEENQIIISREMFADGKSISRINGRNVKLSLLKEISSYLIDIHGQHQNQVLFRKETHIEFLDLFGEKNLKETKENYINVYKEYNELKKELNKLNENKDDMQIQREIDLIKFQINEIESANLNSSEYEELLKQREIYRNGEKIYNNLNDCYSNLYDGGMNAVDFISKAAKELGSISQYDDKLKEYYDVIERIMYEIQDISRDVRNYKENIDFSPYELEQIEQRVDTINSLRRKYGETIVDILKYKDKINSRLEEILNRDEKVEKIKFEISKIKELLSSKSDNLTIVRKKVADLLEVKILKELKSLNMKNVSFKVCFKDLTDFTISGKDDIEFMISFNLGESLKPIYKVASGGEMSRFMLAFKTILSDIDKINTLVFDEIDTGISGIAAQIVCEKLKDISYKKQIICITHLPQIAANADIHFSIEKITSKDRTYTTIQKLGYDNRINEIARLIAGSNITEKTIEHAKEIIQLSIKGA